MTLAIGQRVRILAASHPHSGRKGTLVSYDLLPGLRTYRWKVQLEREYGDNGVEACYADDSQLHHLSLYECEKCGSAKIHSRLRGYHCPMECQR